MSHPETQIEHEHSVHPNSELGESEYEEAFLATFATNENNESETTTPGGQAPPLEAVAAD